jgi:pilus assembly protein CpaB
MESVNKKIVLISLIMALITSSLIYIYIRKATSKSETVEKVSVCVAARSLSPRHKIENADVKQVEIAKEYLNNKAVLNKADIVGKRLKDSIIEGEQILRNRIVAEGKTTLAYSVPSGKRAVSINVNDQINVSHLVRPGDFVDIIASFEREEVEDAENKTVYPRMAKTVIQNVQVLAISQDQQIIDEKIKEPPKTITLSVDPHEAEKLVYISEYAVLRLALRPLDDDDKVDTQGVLRNDITGGKGATVLSK